MSIRSDLRERWFVSGLSIAAAVFFTGALIASTMTYVGVMDAKQRVELTGAIEGAEFLENGSLRISLSITLANPSNQYITMSSVSWNVKVVNGSGQDISYIPLFNRYGVDPEYSELGPQAEMEFEMATLVSDPEKIEDLQGFADYWSSQGVTTTLETIGYYHDFRVVGWLGDYQHDYQYYKTTYLNDMVRIDERYVGGEYQ